MERFIQLNLKTDDEKTEQANLSQQQQVREPDVSAKKLNEIANRAAHRAMGHSKGGLFSK